ncbi:hypothetical protein JCM14036_15110 [Desulfotomaculum defluvii]
MKKVEQLGKITQNQLPMGGNATKGKTAGPNSANPFEMVLNLLASQTELETLQTVGKEAPSKAFTEVLTGKKDDGLDSNGLAPREPDQQDSSDEKQDVLPNQLESYTALENLLYLNNLPPTGMPVPKKFKLIAGELPELTTKPVAMPRTVTNAENNPDLPPMNGTEPELPEQPNNNQAQVKASLTNEARPVEPVLTQPETSETIKSVQQEPEQSGPQRGHMQDLGPLSKSSGVIADPLPEPVVQGIPIKSAQIPLQMAREITQPSPMEQRMPERIEQVPQQGERVLAQPKVLETTPPVQQKVDQTVQHRGHGQDLDMAVPVKPEVLAETMPNETKPVVQGIPIKSAQIPLQMAKEITQPSPMEQRIPERIEQVPQQGERVLAQPEVLETTPPVQQKVDQTVQHRGNGQDLGMSMPVKSEVLAETLPESTTKPIPTTKPAVIPMPSPVTKAETNSGPLSANEIELELPEQPTNNQIQVKASLLNETKTVVQGISVKGEQVVTQMERLLTQHGPMEQRIPVKVAQFPPQVEGVLTQPEVLETTLPVQQISGSHQPADRRSLDNVISGEVKVMQQEIVGEPEKDASPLAKAKTSNNPSFQQGQGSEQENPFRDNKQHTRAKMQNRVNTIDQTKVSSSDLTHDNQPIKMREQSPQQQDSQLPIRSEIGQLTVKAPEHNNIPTPFRDVPMSQVPARLAEMVQTMMLRQNPGSTTIKMKLQPEQLGEVTVTLTWSKGELSAHFVTASGYAKDALEASFPQLRELLAQQNIRLNEAAVFMNQQSGLGQQQSGQGQQWQTRNQNKLKGGYPRSYERGDIPATSSEISNNSGVNITV